jgi:hypothetical protein
MRDVILNEKNALKLMFLCVFSRYNAILNALKSPLF